MFSTYFDYIAAKARAKALEGMGFASRNPEYQKLRLDILAYEASQKPLDSEQEQVVPPKKEDDRMPELKPENMGTGISINWNRLRDKYNL